MMRWLRNFADDVLCRELITAEARIERLENTVDRLRLRRALDRDVRVRAEVSVAELTRANLKLSGLLAERASAPAEPTLDPDAVEQAWKARKDAASELVLKRKARLAAEAAYRQAYNDAYVGESGPEHVRKAVAENRVSEQRTARDAAEVAELAAEQFVRLAELGWRSAMAGAAAPEAGES